MSLLKEDMATSNLIKKNILLITSSGQNGGGALTTLPLP